MDYQSHFVPFGKSDIDGWKIDGSKVRFWATKKLAQEAAKSIGWPLGSLSKVWTRFQLGWALCDGRFGHLSREAFEELRARQIADLG